MALKEDIDLIVKAITDYQGYLQHNAVLLDIWDGNLLQYVMEDLKNQLSPQSYEACKHRISPINILKRVIDKKSRIYSGGVLREIQNGSEQDKELLNFYIESMNLKSTMPLGNSMFNLHKGVALEPYVNNKMEPKLRALPFDRFLVLGLDPTEPERMTHFVKCMGSQKSVAQSYNIPMSGTLTSSQQDLKIYYVFTADEFLVINEKGEPQYDIMLAVNNIEGINPIGEIPQVYVNKSLFKVIPTQDSDTLRMTRLIPVLLSDLNYSVMYSCFSVIYGIDLSLQNIEMSPSAYWDLKSDPTSGKEPKVGIIKPEVDIAEVMNFIMSQIALWLQSQNIRPGSTGEASPEQFASGVAKIVDEADTTEDRKGQINYFIDAEKNLWNLIMHHYHPYWVANGMIAIDGVPTNMLFTPTATVSITFPEQKPEVVRSAVLDEQIKEIQASLTTTERALKKLNPEMSNDQIQELMNEIEKEKTIKIEEAQENIAMVQGEEPVPGEEKAEGQEDEEEFPIGV